eukprot:TRINITY_DN26953_c0_g1_i1.p1 TRINITY_DN26953_c0_g1~~TRINITY_DN26953_c0_g1_i1.p1  ORF type:complete len:190 (+),score=64.80 TRINITY_DN26953_c0_g1_i1:57-572(+)
MPDCVSDGFASSLPTPSAADRADGGSCGSPRSGRAVSAPCAGEDLDDAADRLLAPTTSVSLQHYAAGDAVVRKDGRRCCGLSNSGVPWVLEDGETACVVAVDGNGDFQLRNPRGLVSTWQYSKHYVPQVMLHSVGETFRSRSPGSCALYDSAGRVGPRQAAHSTPHTITLT